MPKNKPIRADRAAERLEDLGFDPIAKAVRLYEKAVEDGDLAVAREMVKLLMPYGYQPQARKAVKGDDSKRGSGITIVANRVEVSPDAAPLPSPIRDITPAPPSLALPDGDPSADLPEFLR